MAIYVEVNGIKYPASITGRLEDRDWDNRESKSLKIEMSYSDAINIFTNDIKWNIVEDIESPIDEFDEVLGEIINKIIITEETYDNSEYSIAGDIIDHRNGYVTIKMGKPTAKEMLAMLEEVL